MFRVVEFCCRPNVDYIERVITTKFSFKVSSQKQRIGSRGLRRRRRYAGKKKDRRRREEVGRNAGHDGHDDSARQRASPRKGRRRAGFVHRTKQDAAQVPATRENGRGRIKQPHSGHHRRDNAAGKNAPENRSVTEPPGLVARLLCREGVGYFIPESVHQLRF